MRVARHMMHGQRPNDACAHPERYTARDMHATEDQVIDLITGFIRALQPDYVIETGTHHGLTARAIGLALQQNGHGHLDTLEIDPDTARIATDLCAGLPVTVHTTGSLDFTPRDRIEFAWIDSAIPNRVPEIRRFQPHFAPHAVIGVHDTGSQFTTKRYLRELEKEGWIRFTRLPTYRGVAFASL